ncbi:hypothetical protein D6817_04525 [Candidatus Pacearchaeota archaeon]|nr:MAG: hypothetical protein D6817_04525 [Candidatus Pacearchaeota archaeon]
MAHVGKPCAARLSLLAALSGVCAFAGAGGCTQVLVKPGAQPYQAVARTALSRASSESAREGDAKFSPSEWESVLAMKLRDQVSTPREAFECIEGFWSYIPDRDFGDIDEWNSLACSLAKGGGDCDDYAIAFYSLISNKPYNCKMVELHAIQKLKFWDNTEIKVSYDHGFCVFEENGFFGFAEPGVYVEPQFASLEELMENYAEMRDLSRGIYRTIKLPQDGTLLLGRDNLVRHVLSHSLASRWRLLQGSSPKVGVSAGGD